MDPLQQTDTWYTNHLVGEQAARWDKDPVMHI